MRDWRGISSNAVPDVTEEDFSSRLRSVHNDIDLFLRDLSRGIQRITVGQVPDGSGGSIGGNGVFTDYVFMPGRPTSGNFVNAVDDSPALTMRSGGLAPADGAVGNPAASFGMGTSGMLDIRPFNFGNTFEAALTGPTGLGTPVYFPSSDGTSGFRITSTTNRTFLQCGLRLSSGNVQNDLITVGAVGARVGTSFAYEFKNVILANSSSVMGDGTAITVGTTRVGVNVRTDQYSTGMHSGIWARSEATSNPGINGEVNADFAGAIGLALRAPSTGSSPNKATGAILATLEEDRTNTAYGSLGLYNAGTWRGSLTVQSAGGADRMTLVDGSSRLLWQSVVNSTWADSVTTTQWLFGDVQSSNRYAMLASAGGNKFGRLGICATSIVMGDATTGVLPSPLSSRLLTVVNSSGTVLSGFDSAGAYFLVTGGASGSLFTSDANGVGSWQATTALTLSFKDSLFTIVDDVDTTKKFQFQASGITPATTRTLAVPNGDVTLAALDLSGQTFTKALTINPGADGLDSLTILNGTAGGADILLWKSSGGASLGKIHGSTGNVCVGTVSTTTARANLFSTNTTVQCLNASWTHNAASSTGGIMTQLVYSLNNSTSGVSDASAMTINGTVTRSIGTTFGIDLALSASGFSGSPGVASIEGLRFDVTTAGSVNMVDVVGVDGAAHHAASGTASTVRGMICAVKLEAGAGTTTSSWGIDITQQYDAAATTSHGIRIQAPTITVAPTTLYGLRIGDQTGATTSWAIYSEGAQSSHAGSFRIGSNSAPTAKVHIDAGTTAANTAPGKIASGSLMTSPEDGAIEYDGSYFSLTNGTPKRGQVCTTANVVVDGSGNVVTSGGEILLAA